MLLQKNLGKGDTLRVRGDNAKKDFYKYIDKTFKILDNINFSNFCFSSFLKSIEFRGSEFIYCDPPYLQTTDTYSNSFTESDSLELFETLQDTGCKWAMSEFNHPFILEQAKQRGLNIIEIGERQNLKNRRTEILVTNYQNRQTSLF